MIREDGFFTVIKMQHPLPVGTFESMILQLSRFIKMLVCFLKGSIPSKEALSFRSERVIFYWLPWSYWEQGTSPGNFPRPQPASSWGITYAGPMHRWWQSCFFQMGMRLFFLDDISFVEWLEKKLRQYKNNLVLNFRWKKNMYYPIIYNEPLSRFPSWTNHDLMVHVIICVCLSWFFSFYTIWGIFFPTTLSKSKIRVLLPESSSSFSRLAICRRRWAFLGWDFLARLFVGRVFFCGNESPKENCCRAYQLFCCHI